MRFLHLADLHFGKSLHGVSLIDNKDQEYFVDQFLKKAEDLQPDAVVIAGDVYDRSAPSGEAVRLFDRFLTRLEKMKIPVMMVAGNHDSGQKLSFAGEILAKQNIYIAGILNRKISHITIPEKDGGEVTFWLLPYLFPALVAQVLEDPSLCDYGSAVAKLLEQQKIDFSKRNVLVAHQNVTADGREVERGGSESMVGGVGQVDYRIFDGFDYVALGHIHSSYHVGRRQVRYAGSPLCYHFDEIKQPAKGFLLVEMGEKGEEIKVETVEIPPLHPMREIRGSFEEIKRQMQENGARGEYLRIVINDRRITPEIAELLRSAFSERGSLVMELVSEFRDSFFADTKNGEVKEKSIEEYFAELYIERRDRAEPGEKDRELFHFAAERVRSADLLEGREESLENDAKKLLDFILKQEEFKGGMEDEADRA